MAPKVAQQKRDVLLSSFFLLRIWLFIHEGHFGSCGHQTLSTLSYLGHGLIVRQPWSNSRVDDGFAKGLLLTWLILVKNELERFTGNNWLRSAGSRLKRNAPASSPSHISLVSLTGALRVGSVPGATCGRARSRYNETDTRSPNSPGGDGGRTSSDTRTSAWTINKIPFHISDDLVSA